MRCAACGELNPDSARFCGRCGGGLGEAVTCPACGAPTLQGQSFCHACGARQAAGSAPESSARLKVPEGERKQVTVLFADVAGSMDLASAMDAEEWAELMERFFAVLRRGVNRFEGRVDKFTGDGVMALFGAPVAFEDHARRACAAALALRDELARFSADLERESGIRFAVRMGLNSGEVVAGAVGEDLKVEYTAVGNTVGLAQRMESLAAHGAVYLTGATATLVEGYFEVRPLGPLRVKGAGEDVPVFELVGHGPALTPLEVAAAKGFSRFVGRERDTAVLDGAFADSVERGGHVVGVMAEPGVGKSRLCHEFAERRRSDGIEVFVAHGLAHARSVPFVPVLEMLRSQFGIGEGDDPTAARAKMYEAVRDLDPSAEESLPLLFDFLGVADPDHPAPAMDADARQRQIFAVLNRLRRARSARAPFVILVEDLHWLDPGSEAFLANLVDSVPGTRQLVVTTFRPEYRPPWGQRSHYRQLPLLPLREAACDELVADLLGRHPSLDGVAELVRERTAGNPFFIEEVVQGLVEEGYLSGRRGAYELADTIDAVRIPATVQAVLGARIDRLAPPEKSLLQTASVIGRQFSRRVITTVSGRSDDDIEAGLRTLIDGELIYQTAAHPDEEYTFKHALTEEVAYGSQLVKQRARTHAAVARVLTELDDKLDERASLIAHHFEASGELLAAARWNARAAAWAGSTHQVEAARLWRSVRELTDRLDQDPEVAQLGFNARQALLAYYWRLGAAAEDGTVPYEEQAAADFSRALTYAEAAGQPALVVGVRTLYSLVLVFAGSVEEGYEQIRQTIRIANETQDLSLRALARMPALYTLYLLGRVQDGVALADEQVRLTEEIRRSESDVVIGASLYADCHQLRIYMRALFGQIDEDLTALEQEIAFCEVEDEWEVAVFARRAWAVTADLAGAYPDRALAHASEARKLADERGGPLLQVVAREGVAVSHAQRSEWQAAIAAADEGLDVCRSRRVPVPSAALLLATRARAHIGQGDLQSARADATEAISAAVRCGTRYYEALARLELARAILAEPVPGGPEQARAEIDQAQSIVETLGLRALVPQIHLARADLAKAEGDWETARRDLETARRRFLDVGAHGRAEQTAEAAQRDPNMSTMLRTDPSG